MSLSQPRHLGVILIVEDHELTVAVLTEILRKAFPSRSRKILDLHRPVDVVVHSSRDSQVDLSRLADVVRRNPTSAAQILSGAAIGQQRT
jgi:hypothetical protein